MNKIKQVRTIRGKYSFKCDNCGSRLYVHTNKNGKKYLLCESCGNTEVY